MLLISPTIRFISCLGSGGFGSVYLAEAQSQSGFSQMLAVKLLNQKMSQVQDIVARQRDEARLLGMLNHDNIVKVYDLGQVNQQSAIFMEYIDGVDLRQLSHNIAIPPRISVLIAAAVASALHAAQNTLNPQTGQPLAVIHRDIKPANILLSTTGVPKVLDFGIARGEFEREGETKSVQFGTAHYMAPEQLLHGTQNASVDIFALGLTLWDLLIQSSRPRLPLHELSFNAKTAEMIDQIRQNRSLRPLIPILARMLSYHPHNRPKAHDVEIFLLQIADELPGPGLSSFAKKHIPTQPHSSQPKTPLPAPSQSTNITIKSVENEINHAAPQLQARSHPLKSPVIWLSILSVIAILAVLSLSFFSVPLPKTSSAITVRQLKTAPPEAASPEAHPSYTEENPPIQSALPAVADNLRPSPPASPQTQAAQATASAPPPSAEYTHALSIRSVPAGMLIKIDAQNIGLTPIQGFPIAAGPHHMTLIDLQHGLEQAHNITIHPSSPEQIQWTFEEGQWQLHY